MRGEDDEYEDTVRLYTMMLIPSQAVGITKGSNGGVQLVTKKTKHVQRPGANAHSVNFAQNKSSRK